MLFLKQLDEKIESEYEEFKPSEEQSEINVITGQHNWKFERSCQGSQVQWKFCDYKAPVKETLGRT